MRPEIAVQVAAAGEVGAHLALDQRTVVLLGAGFRAVLAFGLVLGFPGLDLLLTHVGRIADDRIQSRDDDVPLLRVAQATAGQVRRQADETLLRLHVEKIAAGDTRIILVLYQVAGSEVDRSQVGGEQRDIDAIKIAEQFRMPAPGR